MHSINNSNKCQLRAKIIDLYYYYYLTSTDTLTNPHPHYYAMHSRIRCIQSDDDDDVEDTPLFTTLQAAAA